MTSAMGLPTVMDARGQPTVADEFFGGGKAGDVTNRGQDRHSDDESDAGQVHQVRGHIRPRRGAAQAAEFVINLAELPDDLIQRREVVLHMQPLGRRDLEGSPPRAVLGAEGVAFGGRDLEPVQQAVQTILEHSLRSDQSPPVGQQGPQLTDGQGGHPHEGNQASG